MDVAGRIAEVPYWYHRVPLPGGLVTPGWAPIDPTIYLLPEDLSGETVLDVGAWDGYWSFEALHRGASRVVAIDDFSDRLGPDLEYRRASPWASFDLCRDLLGFDEHECARYELSAYDAARLGIEFDRVLAFGVLYHQRHPLLFLDRLAGVLRPGGVLQIETAICDDFSPYRGGHGHGHDDAVVCEFYPTDELGNQPTNWWAPTLRCLHAMLTAAGFADLAAWKIDQHDLGTSLCRGFATGIKR